MPRYRRATRAGNGRNASQTCICKRAATQVSCECHALLDHGPIDIPDVEVETDTLQSIHCGLPASWTRARRHPPPPRPQSPRAVEAGYLLGPTHASLLTRGGARCFVGSAQAPEKCHGGASPVARIQIRSGASEDVAGPPQVAQSQIDPRWRPVARADKDPHRASTNSIGGV